MYPALRKFDLTGKCAVVTAGGTGLGYQMSKALAGAGATVVICSRRENVLDAAAARLNNEQLAGEVRYKTVDLNDRASITRFIDYTRTTYKGIDIFIGNAAEVGMERVDNIANETIDRMLQVNVSANVELTRAFLPYMRKQKWGRIIFSSTIGSLVSSPHEGMAMYGASKSALNAFARTTATEVGHDGITVNSIVLGFYFTEMMRESCAQLEESIPGASAAFVEGYSSMTALGRLGRPDEVEGLVQLLASEAGSYITGSSLVIDGGMGIMLRPNTADNLAFD